jgi:hypothetical protein
MPDKTRIHWTDDEDLLARFVLGQLDAGEALPLEHHLQECERCKEAVLAERRIAAGVRLAGREELKRRLARRIGQRASGDINWYRVAGIAAAVVLLVTVAIRYQWLTGRDSPRDESSQKIDSVSRPPEQAPAPQVAVERPSIDAMKPTVTQKETESLAGAGARVKGPEADGKKTIREEKGKRGEPAKLGLAKEEQAFAKKDQLAAQAASDAEELWAQGTLAPSVVVTRLMDRAANLAADAKGVEVVTRTQSALLDSATLTVTQRPISALPSMQKGARRTDAVQTLFRQNPAGLQITLFSDTLLNARELAQASIQSVRQDSIVLLLGNKLIGYKTPSGWLRQQKPTHAR